MNAALWGRVDDYIADRLVDEDGTLAAALRANADNGLRPIDVSAAQGKFLHLLVRMSGARRILEIGTLGGYSTIWMAKALPADGSIVTLEYEPRHAEVARRNIERAGYADRIEVRVGAAADTLPLLAAERLQPFDFVFIDADKPNNSVYLEWAIKLGRPGTVIVLDNVVRDGEVANAASRDPNVLGSRGAFELIAADPRLSATALQTVGAKGYDGFAVMILD
ncbi:MULTISPECIES: O-methyltransferase [unclassified Devosia]|uniref:O-methyltransferase n=1 Tax=unclassified Devosia TaxID=196773 RepID=UPI00095B9475|nr:MULTISPECIES: O-methyltransferase [unclassified Devosia]MBN9361457.1 O-methyltransferase [Devosia sp.]OJX26524.1 MAG: methyltransferase [Devosia sp. 66-14]